MFGFRTFTVIAHLSVQHNGRVAAFGPRDTGSNPGEEGYIIKFKSII